MIEQNYENHRKFVPLFHYALFSILVLSLLGSVVNLVQCFGTGEGIYSASLITVIFICLLLLFYHVRSFPLKAQDRAIRAEENFRHYILTGKPLDSKLTLRQIIGLRFASDEEFLSFAQRAVTENISEEDIKKMIKKWRADYHRL